MSDCTEVRIAVNDHYADRLPTVFEEDAHVYDRTEDGFIMATYYDCPVGINAEVEKALEEAGIPYDKRVEANTGIEAHVVFYRPEENGSLVVTSQDAEAAAKLRELAERFRVDERDDVLAILEEYCRDSGLIDVVPLGEV